MTVIERIRRSLEKRARHILKDTWSLEGKIEELCIGRGRRLVWNEDGLTIEVSDPSGKVYGRYRVIVSVSLRAIFPTPMVSSIPRVGSFDSDRLQTVLGRGAKDAVEDAQRTRRDFGR